MPLTKVVRYTGASVVATICSEATFVLLYGPAHVSPMWSSTIAWFAGAVPNSWLSRRWAWQRRGGGAVGLSAGCGGGGGKGAGGSCRASRW